MKEEIKKIVLAAAAKAFKQGLLISEKFPSIEFEEPKHETQGDVSTNFAMISASVQKRAPRKIAEAVIPFIQTSNTTNSSIIKKVEIAGPGFINFFLCDEAWHSIIETIFIQDNKYGSSNLGNNKKVQVEFVSANPTGPLHVGHGRGAAVGDATANILAFAGFDVQKEYYINDSGRQISTLGKSVWLRLLEQEGKEIDFPGDCYQGEYIKDFAKEILLEKGNSLLEKEETEAISECAKYSADHILNGIKDDLKSFGVEFDQWFSEQSLYDSSSVQKTIDGFKSKDIIYEKDGALWFNTEKYGDEKDRVVVRSNGVTTYFASDIAYHIEKFDRGFDRVIDVWGADHHGYIQRINACIDAYGRDSSEQFDVILVQLVNLLRGGKPCAMSTRAGEFVTLKDIVAEVGKDAARFMFLSRSYDSKLDFDLELAKEKSNNNPVFYVQYVHARISSILQKAEDQNLINNQNIEWHEDLNEFVNSLRKNEEIKLIKILSLFGENVEKSAQTLHPHIIFTYLMTLAQAFHSYYNKHKVITENKEISLGRLILITAVKKVIRNGLGLLGVSAPERM
ncbi:MAG: arginine--tRNA ligase [Desulfobacterales bacterium]|nr:arginine--tRNA ligase [Desulfobacterales bacterium]